MPMKFGMRRLDLIAAAQGGVRYGPNLISTGDMEAGSPPTGWTASDATLTSVADESTGGSGTKSLNIAIAAGKTAGAGYADATVENGATYRLDLWAKMVSGDHFTVNIYNSAWGLIVGFDPTTAAAWTKSFYDFVATDTTIHVLIFVIGAQGQQGRIDRVTLREKL
jgi:hypothetical protein